MHIQTLNQTYFPQQNYHSMRLSPQINTYAVHTPNSNNTYQGNFSNNDNMSSYYMSPRDQSLTATYSSKEQSNSKPTSLRQGALIARNNPIQRQNATQGPQTTLFVAQRDNSAHLIPASASNRKEYEPRNHQQQPKNETAALDNSERFQQRTNFQVVSPTGQFHSFVSGTGSSGSGFKKFSTRSKQIATSNNGTAGAQQHSQFSKSFDNSTGGQYNQSQKKQILAAANQKHYTQTDQDYEYLGNLEGHSLPSPQIITSQTKQSQRSDILTQYGEYEREVSQDKSATRAHTATRDKRNRNDQIYGAMIQSSHTQGHRRTTNNDNLTESKYTFGLNSAINK